VTAAVFTLLLGLVVIALIIAANGYFVAQEFAYMSVDRARLRAAAADGDARAQRALEITQRTSFMLSGAQLGITVAGLMIGYVAEPLVGASLGTLLGGVGIPREVSITVGTILALAISTVVQMIFGELFPKNYTIAAPLQSALALARSTRIYLALFGWLIRFFDWSANSLLKLLRIEPVHDVDSTATVADLEHIVSTSRETGDLSENQFLTLDRMLDFPEQDVAHAMIPRSRAGVVHPSTTVAEIRELMAAEHTRYPVIDEDHSPVGVVHMLDLLGKGVADDAPVSSVMREPVVLPELMALPDAVDELRAKDEQLACVIDEYGGFAGILTIEDLAEEILGDLTDEHDVEDQEEITPTAPARLGHRRRHAPRRGGTRYRPRRPGGRLRDAGRAADRTRRRLPRGGIQPRGGAARRPRRLRRGRRAPAAPAAPHRRGGRPPRAEPRAGGTARG